MSVYTLLAERSQGQCELCGSKQDIKEYTVAPRGDESADNMAVLCSTCHDQIEGNQDIDENHWRCLNDAIWNPNPAIQVLAYRQLHKLPTASWAQDLLGMMYMEDETKEWADQTLNQSNIVHKDSNGNILQNGDTVTLIKDLVVKGANFTAKRGTAVRRISLVHDNANHIEGKVDGQHIVILTQFVKKN